MLQFVDVGRIVEGQLPLDQFGGSKSGSEQPDFRIAAPTSYSVLPQLVLHQLDRCARSLFIDTPDAPMTSRTFPASLVNHAAHKEDFIAARACESCIIPDPIVTLPQVALVERPNFRRRWLFIVFQHVEVTYHCP